MNVLSLDLLLYPNLLQTLSVVLNLNNRHTIIPVQVTILHPQGTDQTLTMRRVLHSQPQLHQIVILINLLLQEVRANRRLLAVNIVVSTHINHSIAIVVTNLARIPTNNRVAMRLVAIIQVLITLIMYL